MLIDYVCKKNSRRSSFAAKLATELQRIGFSLWSMCIGVNFGDRVSAKSIGRDMDDVFGNTSVVIAVIGNDFISDSFVFEHLKAAAQYDTIQFILVLCSLNETEAVSSVQNIDSRLYNKFREAFFFNEAEGLNNVSSDIGVLLSDIDASKESSPRISTGISAIDFLLGGGLISGSSFNIIGPSGAGKTTLGVQMQKAVLESYSDRGCLYITYTEAPVKILRRFTDLGCNITEYIANGRFRIYDSYSTLGGLTLDDTRRSVGEEWFPAIIRVDDPADSKSYFENQIKAIEDIGPGGVNIIDNSNKRYEIAQIMRHRDEESYKIHFSRFKARGGDTLQSIGVHIVETDFLRTTKEDQEVLEDHLTRLEDGNIRMRHVFDNETGKLTRKFRVEPTGQIGRGDSRWYEYTVSQSGFIVLNPNFDENNKEDNT